MTTWVIDFEGNRVIADDAGSTIICHMSGSLRNPEIAKDARLIAAAPDMYDVVDAIIKSFSSAGIAADLESNDPAEWLMAKALQAYSKATGEQS